MLTSQTEKAPWQERRCRWSSNEENGGQRRGWRARSGGLSNGKNAVMALTALHTGRENGKPTTAKPDCASTQKTYQSCCELLTKCHCIIEAVRVMLSPEGQISFSQGRHGRGEGAFALSTLRHDCRHTGFLILMLLLCLLVAQLSRMKSLG